jgi:hypothetical protein
VKLQPVQFEEHQVRNLWRAATESIERVRTAFPNVAAGWTTLDLDAALGQADRTVSAHEADLKSNLEDTTKENPYVVA